MLLVRGVTQTRPIYVVNESGLSAGNGQRRVQVTDINFIFYFCFKTSYVAIKIMFKNVSRWYRNPRRTPPKKNSQEEDHHHLVVPFTLLKIKVLGSIVLSFDPVK